MGMQRSNRRHSKAHIRIGHLMTWFAMILICSSCLPTTRSASHSKLRTRITSIEISARVISGHRRRILTIRVCRREADIMQTAEMIICYMVVSGRHLGEQLLLHARDSPRVRVDSKPPQISSEPYQP
ncbi:hypothetical protein LIA77_04013 [Sarocladium implicatum]|nr:hypothetical protein LIA77_04013 [Sarocladium implicatum]